VGALRFSGFDWDSGNWPKCGKHGVSRAEIETMLQGAPKVWKDPYPYEDRFRAIGQAGDGRSIFVVLVKREIDGIMKLRPLSARYMHQKEIDHYANKEL